ncbi:MAG: 3-oxoacyl-ACP reductase FabG [Gammaproteobacteria bacterium]|nr:3-oxoacyl-ACP reductase FabG [Gammaproteobacteria bacterium]
MLENEVALVTGASRGIGQAIVLELGRLGATVIGTEITADGAASITTYMGEQGYKGAGMVVDVTEPDSITALMKLINQDFGPPSILVNNAGIARDNLLMRMKDGEWDAVINTNLSSLYRMSKACVRGMMKARHGRIINISSVVGAMGNAGQTNYGAAKAGVMGFTRSLARELASRNITVNAIAPGFIDTAMTQALPEEQRQTLRNQIPLNRLGSVGDVAAAVVFLASAGAGYVTGETIHVNGGMYMG